MDAYLCVTIDCECDKGEAWRIKKPLSFAAITTGIAHRLQPLFAAYGAKPTYLLSPEVLADPASAECLTTLAGAAEFGTHLHGEFVEPDAFEPDASETFQCNYPAAVERAKLETLTGLFRGVFGYAPTSFRAGRFGIGPHSLPILTDLGYRVDSSVSPLKDWGKAGAAYANFLDAPSQPYWPVPGQPSRTAAGPGPLLEVPVTILPSRLAAVPLLGPRLEPRWLRPTRGSTESLLKIARDALITSARPAVLNCMFHNVEIMPGLSPYAREAAEADAILSRLAALLDFARHESIAVIGLSEVYGLFVTPAR
jgi:hypothetical protein